MRTSLRNIGALGYSLLGTGLIGAALASSVPLTATALLVAGTGFMMGNVTLNTRIQKRVPDEILGRVMAMWSVAFSGSRPLAALINGSVAEVASLTTAYVVGAALVLAALPLVRVRYISPGTHEEPLSELGN